MASGQINDLDEPANQTGFGSLVGASQQSISTHVKNGVLSAGSTYREWLKEYSNHLREVAAGRPENDETIKSVTIREKTANAAHKELLTAQLQGTLVNMDEVFREMQPWFAHMKTQLEASGSRISTMLNAQFGISVDKRLIDKEHRNALSEIAKYVDSTEST